MKTIYLLIGILFITGCTKEQVDDIPVVKEPEPQPGQYSTFTIQKGAHYCDQNVIKAITTSEMKFLVKFDSSAIYQTKLPENQYAVNKLWGFSEGTDNHYNSARIGWSWTDGALRLYAYVYKKGELYYQEITTVSISTEIRCSIKLTPDAYLFTVNGVSVSIPRGSVNTQASGYQQYPYFGGNETSPHLVTILIKNL